MCTSLLHIIGVFPSLDCQLWKDHDVLDWRLTQLQQILFINESVEHTSTSYAM
jgi:hypothetical protein